jgi:hypothetical protein
MPTFHEEVVSSTACALHDLGFFVLVYIGNGVNIGGLMVPFSGRRQRSSEAFYGRCVSQWQTIYSPIKHVYHPDIIVFVTYPMLLKGFKNDNFALDLIKKTKEDNSHTPIVMITHRPHEMYHDIMKEIDSYVPRNRLIYMYLGEHTKLEAEKIVSQHNNNNSNSNIQLEYLYPVLPKEYITRPESASIDHIWSMTDQIIKSNDYRPLFAMQGNFGGKHAHRKNPKVIVDCLRSIENGTMILPNNKSYNNSVDIKLSIDIIGHLDGDLDIGKLEHGQVRFLNNLGHRDYFTAIARSKFMIAAIGEDAYYTSRATSSVPAALIGEIPLVTNRDFLNIYPCLRDAPMHKYIASATECQSIAVALTLRNEQYNTAKDEIKKCSSLFWNEAKQKYNKIINTAKVKSANNI